METSALSPMVRQFLFLGGLFHFLPHKKCCLPIPFSQTELASPFKEGWLASCRVSVLKNKYKTLKKKHDLFKRIFTVILLRLYFFFSENTSAVFLPISLLPLAFIFRQKNKKATLVILEYSQTPFVISSKQEKKHSFAFFCLHGSLATSCFSLHGSLATPCFSLHGSLAASTMMHRQLLEPFNLASLASQLWRQNLL